MVEKYKDFILALFHNKFHKLSTAKSNIINCYFLQLRVIKTLIVFPHNHGSSACNIKRMLGTNLRNFQTVVCSVYHFLCHTLYLIAHNNSHGTPVFPIHHIFTSFHLFQRNNDKTLFAQVIDAVYSILVVSPVHAVFSPQSRLVNLLMRRSPRDAAHTHLLNAEAVGGAQNRTYVIHAPYIVEHNNKGNLLRQAELFCAQAIHIQNRQFVHIETDNNKYRERSYHNFMIN